MTKVYPVSGPGNESQGQECKIWKNLKNGVYAKGDPHPTKIKGTGQERPSTSSRPYKCRVWIRRGTNGSRGRHRVASVTVRNKRTRLKKANGQQF